MPRHPTDLSDLRISRVRPLITPALLAEELPLTAAATEVVTQGRTEAAAILDGSDDRLLIVVGPCSVHDPAAALDYAQRLAPLAAELSGTVRVVMRVYFEKPRTTLGWKGLLNDPHLDGSYDVNSGLRAGRKLLLDILALGIPVGCEFLDPITPQYLADAVSWGSIGARTATSQVHRQLCSGLSMPIGIKNSTSGDVQEAADAVAAAAGQHVFPGITADGLAAIMTTTGNPDCHVILRGGRGGPNYHEAGVAAAMRVLAQAGLPSRLVVDASHGNSGKDHRRQPDVAGDLARRIADGERGVVGVMLESFLVAGRQDLILGEPDRLSYGQSITDSCMSFDTTAQVLRELAAAVNHGRTRARVPVRG
ncbi:MAG: 3-deoxy-7-phosphoheptulonate synthase [Sciscionella sp.]